MNKILNINLGGYALTIDDDAYEYLQAYLESIRRRFSESEGRDEILSDIETRLGELISGSMGSRTIVMLPDVEAAASVMGKPEEFGSDEPQTEPKKAAGSKSGSTRTKTSAKRLFRDEEDSVVAGICSGLTAYFGMSDPVWMRLIFVLLAFLSFGFWVPAYLLMWILVPPARSTADRLAMRGEPVNVDNIAREIEEGFDRLGNKVNEMGSQAKKSASGAQNAMSTGVTAIGQIFGFMIRFIVKFAGLLIILLAAGLFLAFGTAWITGIWAMITAAPVVAFFSPFSTGTTWLGFANLFFLVGIPLVGLALFFSRLLFKTRTPAWAGAGLTLFWILNFISAFILTSVAAKEFRRTSSITKTIDLSGIRSDTLHVDGIHIENDILEDAKGSHVNIDGWDMDPSGSTEVRIKRSSSGRFECTQIISARGNSQEDAMDNAGQTQFSVALDDNHLKIPTGYVIQKGRKWKAQSVRVEIGIPVGKYIIFDNEIYHHSGAEYNEYAEDNESDYISRRPNKMFKMSNDGLICADCPRMGDKDYRGERYFENFILEGDLKAEIIKGDDFRVRIEGDQAAKNSVETLKTGDKITFTTNGKTINGAVRIVIETPVFTSLYADKTDDVVIRGFNEGNATITARNGSHIKAYMDVNNELELILSGKSSLDLSGDGSSLQATLTDGALLDAGNWRANDAEISASEGSKARIYVKNNALVTGDAADNVRVDGGAVVKHSRNE